MRLAERYLLTHQSEGAIEHVETSQSDECLHLPLNCSTQTEAPTREAAEQVQPKGANQTDEPNSSSTKKCMQTTSADEKKEGNELGK